MTQWPHAPVHILDKDGTYMVTSGTYHKERLFDSPEKLQILHDTLLCLAPDYGWNLQAWAVMSNHYHFIAISQGESANLSKLISKLHMVTAKQINIMDNAQDRKVWFQYWDSRITFEKSYLARLNYVHNNPVHHGIVDNAVKYAWCSAAWFEKSADGAFYKTVRGFKTDRLTVKDDF